MGDFDKESWIESSTVETTHMGHVIFVLLFLKKQKLGMIGRCSLRRTTVLKSELCSTLI